MTADSPMLMDVYRGWEGYQTSLVKAITPLSSEQLTFRPAPHLSSVEEIARHIIGGRLNWFVCMQAPGSAELAKQVPQWKPDEDGNRLVVEEALATGPTELVEWLEATWQMIEATLTQWSVADLEQDYRLTYRGTTYAISRQWTLWRILSHDMHHGGQLSVLLYMQGVDLPELGDRGGHLTELSLAEPA